MWTRHCGFLIARDLRGWVANRPALGSSVVNIRNCLRLPKLAINWLFRFFPVKEQGLAEQSVRLLLKSANAEEEKEDEDNNKEEELAAKISNKLAVVVVAQHFKCGWGFLSRQDFEMTPLVTKRFLLRAWSVSQVNSPVLGLVRTAQTLTMPDHRKPASHAGSQRFSPTLHISPMQTPSSTMYLVGNAWLVDWGGLKTSDWDQSCFEISFVFRSVLL